MWIVELALRRPYTFIVGALLILILSPIVILRTSIDIFPNIDIPVVSILWNYSGFSPQEMERRIISPTERNLTTTVNDIEHTESISLNGIGLVKVFFHPSVRIDMAVAQIAAISQTQLRQLPIGTTPPLIIQYNASSVPIVQLSTGSHTLSEQTLNDLSLNFIRPQLTSVQGVAVPYPYGGKTRQIQVDLDIPRLQALGLTPSDVVAAMNEQNLILPSGTAKVGLLEYQVSLNGSPQSVEELNNLPVKNVNGTIVYIRDVAHVRDGFAPQTNIVRQDGVRSTLISVLKNGNVSTLDIVSQVKALVPKIKRGLPEDVEIKSLFDQSLFVRASIEGVVREGVIAACLTALMILLFLGDWKSTLIIAISIPLSVLSSILILSAIGETINIMTLGGLALAVGILVDDATVTIENIDRYLDKGLDLHDAILQGASQIAVPAFVSSLCICIVFVPMFLLSGVARFLFVPLAESVVFAVMASYVLSRTLVPTLAMYLLKTKHEHAAVPSAGGWSFIRLHQMFDASFNRLRSGYSHLLGWTLRRRALVAVVFLTACVGSLGLIPFLGQDFFPTVDAGEFKLHVRAKTGTRIEETAKLCDQIEGEIRRIIPARDVGGVIDNIGLPYSSINLSYSNSGVIGTADADILVSLNPGHQPTANYKRQLRRELPRLFPGTSFYFQPSDIVNQILNFGLSAPIDIQLIGRNLPENFALAHQMVEQLKAVPGATDVRVQQVNDLPEFKVQIERSHAEQLGISARDIATTVLNSLSGSFQTSPSFWLDPKNGVNYNVAVQSPQYNIASLQDLENLPVHGSNSSQILANLSSISREAQPGVAYHYGVLPVVDVYANVDGTDLGSVATQVNRIVDEARKQAPKATDIVVRGQVKTMNDSFIGLGQGLIGAIVLVYLLMVVNFQSWVEPLIIISALPGALAGICWMLFFTHTTLSVPALMGAIMCIGVATANSILIISFAKERLEDVGEAAQAVYEAATIRLRPVIMTALAMIIGMVPMALGLGEGGEQNAPLGRAVIGGLLVATLATLFFVPVVYSLVRGGRRSGHAPSPELTQNTPVPVSYL